MNHCKLKGFQGLEFLFSNSRPFKDRILNEPSPGVYNSPRLNIWVCLIKQDKTKRFVNLPPNEGCGRLGSIVFGSKGWAPGTPVTPTG